MNHTETLQLRVKSITWEADGILSYELHPEPPLKDLPAFGAGAHIDLHLPNGLIRSYSLLNAPGERRRYVIGVNKDARSRGGSRYLHEILRPGDTVTVAPPRNNFPLDENAPLSVFIAGGIGITPIFGMIQRLRALGRPWHLHYAARTRRQAAFVDALEAMHGLDGAEVHMTFDREAGARMLDIPAIAATLPDGAHIYCCGPVQMLEAFETATAALPPDRVHREYFAAREAAATEGGFVVQLARTGRSLEVPSGKTILDCLLSEGIEPPYSCQEGVCGTCEVRVLEGVPDHRDLVLSEAERATNKRMMICCSGAKSRKLILDL
ncbi:oxidoreductase [Cupriavidus sp. USMAHM13]|uniref:Oxidoreductase n=1 Tax=Cupriavidus malaysiensis TaxID=367825 RepID=A0A1D9IB63_9BURK|nr:MULTISPECIES: PDR/VanB family oxidoreductase [Cupriavidus]AOZ03296.1 oxidoreductase [Cupriavidus sp. USMAHM13]AOZ09342.1 oxidoreductase [Cupriavidus malaysiensis]